MSDSFQKMKAFLLQLDQALETRKLHAPSTQAYRDAAEKLFEKLQAATAEGGFTLQVGSADLYFGKTSVFHGDEREAPFFFPLYRDGLREIRFLEIRHELRSRDGRGVQLPRVG